MKKVILLLALVFSTGLYAQEDTVAEKPEYDEAYVNSLVTEFTNSLQERGINTWFYTYRYCVGAVEIFTLKNNERCITKGNYTEAYVFWKEEIEGEEPVNMIKKIDNCGLFMSLPLEETTINEYVIENKNDLKNRKVKPYGTKSRSAGPISRTEVHPCYREFTIKVQDDMFKQKYPLFDLTNASASPNMNATYNNSTEIVALDKMIDEIILKTQSKFKRLSK